MVTVIDLGSSKICALIGQIDQWGELQVVGIGVVPSRGLKRGVVTSVEEAVASIEGALDKAERQYGDKVANAYLGLSGGHITSTNNRGVVAVSREDGVIAPEDVQRAVDAARVITLPSNREILHVIPAAYKVDGQEGIKSPVGMIGYRLDVETHIITAEGTALRNIANCLAKVGVTLDGIVLQSLAASEALLTEEERELGVVLADIGGGTTDVIIFSHGSPRHTAVISVAGDNITRDIAIGLQIPLATAESLKTESSQVPASSTAEEETVEAVGFGGGERRDVSRKRLCEIVDARLREIFGLIGKEIEASGLNGFLPAGIVLSGGAAELAGIEELGRETTGLPVRIGHPTRLSGLVDTLNSPAYATSVGLVLWAARASNTTTRGRKAGAAGGLGNAALKAAPARILRWVRAFFP